MKKLYQGLKWKKHSQKRSFKQLALTRKRNSRVNFAGHKSQQQLSLPPIIVVAPKIFNILKNTEQMLSFFDEVREVVRKKRRVFLNMEEVSELTQDAILYMLSLIYHYRQKNNYRGFLGNIPKDEKSCELFKESGFFKFIARGPANPTRSTKTLQIEMGKLVNPELAYEVVRFAAKHLQNDNLMISKGHYSTLVECMGNTNAHAYVIKKASPYWYLMAVYNESKGRVRFTFLDGGEGMPDTLRVNFAERVARLFSTNTDAQLIMSALQGQFRTRTGERKRGKGLPKIYENSKAGNIDELKIISSYAKVDCASGELVTLKKKFVGTLLTWDYLKN